MFVWKKKIFEDVYMEEKDEINRLKKSENLINPRF